MTFALFLLLMTNAFKVLFKSLVRSLCSFTGFDMSKLKLSRLDNQAQPLRAAANNTEPVHFEWIVVCMPLSLCLLELGAWPCALQFNFLPLTAKQYI